MKSKGHISHAWLSALLLCLAGRCSFAAPFEVSSPRVADHAGIEATAQWTHRPSKQTWELPKLELATPLGDDIEVKLSDQYRRVDTDGRPSVDGLGDAELEVKWAFARQHHDTGFDMAIEPALQLPSGDRSDGLGAGATQLALPLLIGRTFGRLELETEIAYTHVFGTDSDALGGGLLGLWKTTARLKLGLELYARAPARHFSGTELDGNAGFKWAPLRHWELKGLIGRTLRNAADDPRTRVKLVTQYTF